ncbi:MAG: rRNA maturation RNase YbeY [Woeseiaceae bacterium]|nr:rRNA maturation RNase YbeY [Woeseiaceae bacterium]
MNVLVDVQLACSNDTIPEADDIDAWVTRAVMAAGKSRDHEVSVRIVSADEIQALNREFRDSDRPTNVLSFPTGPIDGLPAGEPVPLGDIVVCAEVVVEEAKAQGKRPADHWAHMLVHGTLHLMGFDHQEEPQAAEMEGMETEILTEHGLRDPYKEPAHC